MSRFIESLAQFARKHRLFKPGDRVAVAVSGGADSVSLLLAMQELRRQWGIPLSVIHFNHQLRGIESDTDELFVQTLAKQHNLEFFCGRGDVAQHAKDHHSSLEAAARELRYEYFIQLLRAEILNRIATAHTLDDQAETVLLKLCRGAGTRGLSGIYPILQIGGGLQGSIVRPFLQMQRRDIEDYLVSSGQQWREDHSNRDVRHSRNRVRHNVLPILERDLNPAIRQALGETAEIFRAEEEYWHVIVRDCLSEVWKPFPDALAGGTIHVANLAVLSVALRRRLIRAIAESLGLHFEFKHVEKILVLAGSDRGENSLTAMPGGWRVNRDEGKIYLSRNAAAAGFSDYEYILPVPGRVLVAEAGRVIETKVVHVCDEPRYNPDHAIDAAMIGDSLRVRNWRAGDRFWPAHTKRSKKIKDLLQERHLTSFDRKQCPVVVSGTGVIWLSGFPVSAASRPRSEKAVIIRDAVL